MSSSKRQTISGLLNVTGLFIALGGMVVVSVVSLGLGARVLFDREGETAFPTIVSEYFWIGVWLFLSAVTVLLVGWAILWLLARRISRPISQLAASAERAAVSSAEVELKADPRLDEVHRLAASFNRLLVERARQSEEIRNLSRNALHDLRAPLVQMCDEADQLAHGLVNPEEAAMAIQKEGRALMRVIEASAEISTNYSGHDSMLPTELDVAALVRDVADVYAAGAESKRIRLLSEIPMSLSFVGHEIKMRRLVGNLLDNAVKYTPEGGWISLKLARTEKGVVLEVADSGCGIPRCEQTVMYERFYRGAAANRCPGIGLGLSMVHSIVMFYHGDITCVSDVGKGTSFRVFLPC